MPNSVWDNSYVDDLLMVQIENLYGEGAGGILYTPEGAAAPISMNGVFEAAASVVEVSGEVQVESVKPVIRMRLKHFDDAGIEPEHGDMVEVDGKTYRVDETQPDGHAEITLVLTRNL